MRPTLLIVAWMVLAGAVAGMAGCASDPAAGYTTRSLYPEDVRSVAVPIWTRGRDVYRRELEMRLTEAIIKRLELDTPYKVTRRSRADTELRGTIDNFSQRVLAFHPDTGAPQETEITLTVSFTWTDLRSGKVLVERTGFRQASTYFPPQPSPRFRRAPEEDPFQGSEDALNKLAQRIVEQLESEW